MNRLAQHAFALTATVALLSPAYAQVAVDEPTAEGAETSTEEVVGRVSGILETGLDALCDPDSVSLPIDPSSWGDAGGIVSGTLDEMGIDPSSLSTFVGEEGSDHALCEHGSIIRKADRYVVRLTEGPADTMQRTASNILRSAVRDFGSRPSIPSGTSADASDGASEGAGGPSEGSETEIPIDPLATELTDDVENINEALGRVGEEGLQAYNDYRAALQDSINTSYTSAAQNVVDDALDPERHEEGTAERERADALAASPGLTADQLSVYEQRRVLLQQMANVDVTAAASEALTGEFMENTGYQDTIARTVAPDGTAERMRQAAAEATSTRQALTEMTNGWADYMKQDAVLSGAVLEGLRTMVQQQTLTNHQLQAQAGVLFEEQRELIDQQQQEVDRRIAQQAVETEAATRDMMESLARVNNVVVAPTEDTLYSYCDIHGC